MTNHHRLRLTYQNKRNKREIQKLFSSAETDYENLIVCVDVPVEDIYDCLTEFSRAEGSEGPIFYVFSIQTEHSMKSLREVIQPYTPFLDNTFPGNVESKLKEALEIEEPPVALPDYKLFDFPGRDWVDIAIDSDVPAIIFGETGTGKTALAEDIHKKSGRQGKFISVNLAAVPESLFASILYGYTPGAYSGALEEGKKGLFEQAENGTLFLDEITEVPHGLQGELLQSIAEDRAMAKIQKVGTEDNIEIDVRVIAATNRDPENIIKNEELRNDLFYRFPIKITMPTLEELLEINKNNLKELVQMFIFEDAPYATGAEPDDEVIQLLRGLEWAGNIRQLKVVVQNALRRRRFLRASSEDELESRLAVTARDILWAYEQEQKFVPAERKKRLGKTGFSKSFCSDTDLQSERMNIEKQLAEFILKSVKHKKNKTAAARTLGIHYNTFSRMLEQAEKEKKVSLF